MTDYWYIKWLDTEGIGGSRQLKKTFRKQKHIDSLLNAIPNPGIPTPSAESYTKVELAAGKGIDLTGNLGCHHVDCLKREVDELFHRAWHYFDLIALPDQAVAAARGFEQHKDIALLSQQLATFTELLSYLRSINATQLVTFRDRMPACRMHYKQHANEAGIGQAITNLPTAINALQETSPRITWELTHQNGHQDLKYTLTSPLFQHMVAGSLCSLKAELPQETQALQLEVISDVVVRYLSELSADALAARQENAALGATIQFYRRLLAVRTAPVADADVAFELELPVVENLSAADLIRLRCEEAPLFQRFQHALRRAIEDRVRAAPDGVTAARIKKEIIDDVINPELRRISDELSASRTLAARIAAGGVLIASAAVTVGLFAPLHSDALATGLTAAGSIEGLSAIRSAIETVAKTRSGVSLSDMYFLWKAHSHN